MHDARGKELQVGDRVMVPMEVIRIGSDEGYCNLGLRSLATMPPDDRCHTDLGAINTKMVFRANVVDEFGDFKVDVDGEACRLR